MNVFLLTSMVMDDQTSLSITVLIMNICPFIIQFLAVEMDFFFFFSKCSLLEAQLCRAGIAVFGLFWKSVSGTCNLI